MEYHHQSSSESLENAVRPDSLHNKEDHTIGKVYKVVLTGGPCGGKTTGQSRLCTFFENLGWKVYCIPETATILLATGIKFPELDRPTVYQFQKNLILTMMQIEKSIFDLAASESRNVIYICDRGLMDATAFLPPEDWTRMKRECGWNEIDLRDSRYDSIIHLVTAAKGAEQFYTTDDHAARKVFAGSSGLAARDIRFETVDQARIQDDRAQRAWIGHPAYDVIDNSTGFEAKIQRLIQTVCRRLGIYIKNWPQENNTRKRKWLIKTPPDFALFPKYQEFYSAHDYLATAPFKSQARIRKRGSRGHWTFTHTIRRPPIDGQCVELKMNVDHREYHILRAQRDPLRATLHTRRICFIWDNQYYTLDIYLEPCPEQCRSLVVLQTYTDDVQTEPTLPPFLDIDREITKESQYSMYNLALLKYFSVRRDRARSAGCIPRCDSTNHKEMTDQEIDDIQMNGDGGHDHCNSDCFDDIDDYTEDKKSMHRRKSHPPFATNNSTVNEDNSSDSNGNSHERSRKGKTEEEMILNGGSDQKKETVFNGRNRKSDIVRHSNRKNGKLGGGRNGRVRIRARSLSSSSD